MSRCLDDSGVHWTRIKAKIPICDIKHIDINSSFTKISQMLHPYTRKYHRRSIFQKNLIIELLQIKTLTTKHITAYIIFINLVPHMIFFYRI